MATEKLVSTKLLLTPLHKKVELKKKIVKLNDLEGSLKRELWTKFLYSFILKLFFFFLCKCLELSSCTYKNY